jgi:S-disulfanyl-L-cysteine oxidoreductase SoxD
VAFGGEPRICWQSDARRATIEQHTFREDTMTRMATCSALFSAFCTAALVLTPLSAQEKTTWDGVYSTAQAQRAEPNYNEKCAKCHGKSAGGGDAPSLSDSGFAGNWDGLNLQQLFDRTRTSMPQDAPGSMSRQETADMIAYLLQQNRFPAGANELPESANELSGIKYVATKP